MNNTKLIYGINDLDSPARVDGKICPLYNRWRSMLERCYSPKYQLKFPTYVGCRVCPEWLHRSRFTKWMEQQPWAGNQLDKDFLGDGKLYSPGTCVFVPSWLNKLFTDHGRARGEFPIGVSSEQGKYRARLSLNTGTQKHLGLFDTAAEAHLAYVNAKVDYVRSLYPQIEAIDSRLPQACERKLAILLG